MGMGWGNIYEDGVGMGKILRGWGGDGVNFFSPCHSLVCATFTCHMSLAWLRDSGRTSAFALLNKPMRPIPIPNPDRDG